MGLCLIADVALNPLLHYAWVIFKMLFGLGLVIFVHELGHFLVAKACGVKCEKFYIGFDAFQIRLGPLRIPASLWKRTIGETEYGIGILPLGGYVKMLGQDDNPRNAETESARIRVRPADAPTEQPPSHGQDEEDFVLDPRSFPARPVPQRMAIISAGVVMNLIFAVLFAAIAFQFGVSYVPCLVGNVTPGDPAWKAGLEPRDQIIQVGAAGKPSDTLRFGSDLSVQVVLNGADRELSLLVRRPNGETHWIRATPTNRLAAYGQRAALGIHPADTNQLGPSPPSLQHFPAAQAGLQENDVLAAADERALANGADVQAYLAQHPSEPVRFTVERGSSPPASGDPGAGGKLQLTVPPNPLKVLGLTMTMGPIVAVRQGSPAEAAGLQAGDVIGQWDGQDVGDPLTFPQRTLRLAGRAISLNAHRGNSTVALTITPQLPQMYHSLYGPEAPLADESLGIAYRVASVVASVEPGGPADVAGIQPGDEITAAEFVSADQPQAAEQPLFLQSSFSRVIPLKGEQNSWPEFQSVMQWVLPETKVKLWYHRGGEAMQPVEIAPQASAQWFWEERGLGWMLLTEIRSQQAASWSDALALGYQETKRRFVEVLRFLGQLATFRMSFTGLTGPVGLVKISFRVAEAGIVDLLMFLTFLSVNLAILNFLPIPALDGGHMLFLTAEAIRGKPIDETLQIRLTILGIGFLLTLMLFVTVLDINRDWF